MLPAVHRLHRADDFRAAVRGRKAGSALVVVHQGRVAEADEAPRVGFAVNRAVGPAVVRNRVKRRLRHLVRERLSLLEPGALYVVRATPASAHAAYDDLGQALDGCLRKLGQGRGPGSAGGRR